MMRQVNIGKGRLEAFSDGVIAIIITIMVLEMHPPKGFTFADLKAEGPIFLNYIMSFIYVAIYWNNHHHMMHIVKSINGAVLWANTHLLFWLSLVPFASAWMGESSFTDRAPIALYGFILLMNAIAYSILVITLLRHEGPNSALAQALGKDWKGNVSIAIYVVALLLTCFNTYISFTLYVLVACMWFVPDRRIERKLAEAPSKSPTEGGDFR